MRYEKCKHCGKKGVHKVLQQTADRATYYRKCKYCKRLG